MLVLMSVRRVSLVVALLASAATTVEAQSLFVLQGDRAVDAAVGWSVGPFSQGLEIDAGVSLDGRWDVGGGVHWYRADYGGTQDETVVEWAPFVRYLLVKEQDDGAPVTLAAVAQLTLSDAERGADGWYVLAGGQLYKKLEIADGLGFYPFVGFSLTAESFAVGDADPDRELSLTRQFGVHGVWALGGDMWLRLTAEEQSFRRETFRGVRVAVVRRF